MANSGVKEVPFPKARIEAIQTVMPVRITDPRRPRLVSASDPVSLGIFRRCLNVIFYYTKEEESGWSVAGWIKESLGRALVEQPMISGRLRRGEEGDGELEVVPNDSGVRLVEARMSADLSEFLESQVNTEEAEAELVFWKYIDEQNPQFCPLFYVQVTNFQCGGYSIGISSSILLLDFILRENFLQQWADIHSKIIRVNGTATKAPIFYLPNLKKSASLSPTTVISPSFCNNSGQTMIFKITADRKDLDVELCNKLSLLCLLEAEKKLGEVAEELPLFLSESLEAVKVETCSKQTGVFESGLPAAKKLVHSDWVDFGLDEVSFSKEGKKPVLVSCWHGFVSGGVMVAMPSSDEGICVIITVPKGGF